MNVGFILKLNESAMKGFEGICIFLNFFYVFLFSSVQQTFKTRDVFSGTIKLDRFWTWYQIQWSLLHISIYKWKPIISLGSNLSISYSNCVCVPLYLLNRYFRTFSSYSDIFETIVPNRKVISLKSLSFKKGCIQNQSAFPDYTRQLILWKYILLVICRTTGEPLYYKLVCRWI